jgi:hypothetical protein
MRSYCRQRSPTQAVLPSVFSLVAEIWGVEIARWLNATAPARRKLDNAIDCGRCAELFDFHNGELVPEPDQYPEQTVAAA